VDSQPTNSGDRKNSAIPNLQTKGHKDFGRSARPSVPDTPTARLRRLLPTAWGIIRPYWASEDRWVSWGLLLLVIALNLGMVYISVLFNQWNFAFNNALQQQNYVAFREQLIRVIWLAALVIVVAVYQDYYSQMIHIRWRRWLTERYLRTWLADGAYYRMQLASSKTDNPDQRIAEDVNLLISLNLELAFGGLRSVVTLISFVAILWGLSGTLTIPIGGYSIMLPGYMLWVVLLYAILGTWLTDFIGRPLVRLNFDRQRYEADFRFGLVRFRENTEGVALYRGEADELRGFRQRFEDVVRNWWQIMRRQKRLNCFTNGYAQMSYIFPFMVATPRYFRGEIPFGALTQTVGAFGQVQDSLSFIVSSYKSIAEWLAVVERLSGFELALDRVRTEAARGGVRHVLGAPTSLTVNGLDLDLPDGHPLITDVNLSVGRGDTVLLGGPSGSGKSTLLRAIAGIWPFGRGEIRQPRLGRILFLPQKPYLPIGTLREVVSYPMPPSGVDDATLRETLNAVELPELAGRLDEAANWGLQLSPGEQQRIAFARALVQKPDWLFVDEATSAVDEATEARLYRLLHERLAGTAVFSVGHRGTLRRFHARELAVQPNGDGLSSIVEVTPVPALPRRGVATAVHEKVAAMAG
jgi:vitamin B12/bleomycin/antimicrobial peptide transport system ATP-binding/permease protein